MHESQRLLLPALVGGPSNVGSGRMEKNAGSDLKHFVRWARSSLYIPPSL